VGLIAVLVVAVAAFGWLTVIVAWSITGRRVKISEAVGGAPFWRTAPLEDGERVVARVDVIKTMGRVQRFLPVHFGLLCFTDRRMIYVPARGLPVFRDSVVATPYARVTSWQFQRVWQGGLRGSTMARGEALTIVDTIGHESRYVAALLPHTFPPHARAALLTNAPNAREA